MGLPEPPPVGVAALPPGTFADQVVVVTGGGTGLGKAIATEFGRLGARVAIASRKPDHLEAGLSALSDVGADVMAVACDIRDPNQIAKCFDEIEAQWQLPAVLVNNAATNFPVPAEDMSPNAWRTVIDITLNGMFLMSREFARRH
ncbi:MAG: SDR family NAD(P)-dependent oxidoreductase, partial [Actinobacteria bacterium]